MLSSIYIGVFTASLAINCAFLFSWFGVLNSSATLPSSPAFSLQPLSNFNSLSADELKRNAAIYMKRAKSVGAGQGD